jgi:hypothetical protein
VVFSAIFGSDFIVDGSLALQRRIFDID